MPLKSILAISYAAWPYSQGRDGDYPGILAADLAHIFNRQAVNGVYKFGSDGTSTIMRCSTPLRSHIYLSSSLVADTYFSWFCTCNCSRFYSAGAQTPT